VSDCLCEIDLSLCPVHDEKAAKRAAAMREADDALSAAKAARPSQQDKVWKSRILRMYDAIGGSPLFPPPADPSVAHPPRPKQASPFRVVKGGK